MNAVASRVRLVLLFALGALAFAAQAEPIAGREYTLLAPAQKPQSQDKIEVLEFFSYACPHCYAFHPQISEWADKLPKNAKFVRVPVSFGRPDWGQLVRAYYALESLGELQRLDMPLFEALHKERRRLVDEASITAWVATQGVSAEKFKEAFNSFNASTRASQAEQLSRNYQVEGVPHVVIDGKYQIAGSSFDQILGNADQVLRMLSKQQ